MEGVTYDQPAQAGWQKGSFSLPSNMNTECSLQAVYDHYHFAQNKAVIWSISSREIKIPKDHQSVSQVPPALSCLKFCRLRKSVKRRCQPRTLSVIHTRTSSLLLELQHINKVFFIDFKPFQQNMKHNNAVLFHQSFLQPYFSGGWGHQRREGHTHWWQALVLPITSSIFLMSTGET